MTLSGTITCTHGISSRMVHPENPETLQSESVMVISDVQFNVARISDPLNQIGDD